MRNFSVEILILRNIKIADSFVSTKSVRIIEVWLYFGYPRLKTLLSKKEPFLPFQISRYSSDVSYFKFLNLFYFKFWYAYTCLIIAMNAPCDEF